MASSRLTSRERPKRTNAALQSLEKQPFPADCALPWCVWGALSSTKTIRLEHQQPTHIRLKASSQRSGRPIRKGVADAPIARQEYVTH